MAFLPIKDPEEELDYHRELHTLISELSNRLKDTNLERLDKIISYGLEKVGSLVDVDRSYLCILSEDKSTFNNTHEWCADCMHPQMQNLQNIPVNTDSWWFKRLSEIDEICVPNVSSLPDTAKRFKKTLTEQSIKSLIMIPVTRKDQLIGFVGFDSVRRERNWMAVEVRLLRRMGELFSHALGLRIVGNK